MTTVVVGALVAAVVLGRFVVVVVGGAVVVVVVVGGADVVLTAAKGFGAERSTLLVVVSGITAGSSSLPQPASSSPRGIHHLARELW